MKPDLLGIVEAAYADVPSRAAWQSTVLDACSVMDEGRGVILSTAVLNPTGLEYREPTGTVPRPLLDAFCQGALSVDPPAARRAFAEGTGKTGSMVMGAERFTEQYAPAMSAFGIADCLAINGAVDASTNFGLYVLLAKIRSHPKAMVQRLSLLGIHLAAARRRFTVDGREEAWVDPNGKVIDATGDAPGDVSALSLRAKAIDMARTPKGRSDIDSALGVWKCLVAGNWSLIERFESDGRRFLVAKRNAPDLGKRLRLTQGEEQVAKLCAMGHSQKYVAYALGKSQAMVSAHLASAMLKLRVRTRGELLSMCSGLLDA